MGRKPWVAAAALMMSLGAGAQTSAPPVLDEALDAPTRAHVINEFAHRLTELHVDGPRAKAAADDLRKRLARGEYDSQLTARALAARVTADVAAIAPDRHTYLEFVPYDLGDERQRPPAPAPAADNYGLRKFDLLDNNIGYLKITRFAPLDRGALDTAARLMDKAADSSALIIDLRDAGGDSQEMVALLSSYLLVDQRSIIFKDAQIHLHDQIDRSGRVVAEYWTYANVSGKRFGGVKPLYLLVSNRTSGAAEAFAYDLQQYMRRAIASGKSGQRALVIGAPTLGDARVGSKQRISRQLQTSVAISRASNVLTRYNWEGGGVQPDRMVDPAAALDTALGMAQAAIRISAATPAEAQP
ncbi:MULTISPECIES: S41 family peptidase [unclassified Duganella]|uniref:S41 family peptidase n=1 Tax=unclassified Duganella TaxID=2636909 RepID=UPI000881D907|nr:MULTISPECIES: S41 family peptidase [unclassified Duganella]SDF46677.1 Peptidase family S41 [Duganella sp. OV458]SDI80093.1 Peptidase family S41 [Duganella sp. OV510]